MTNSHHNKTFQTVLKVSKQLTANVLIYANSCKLIRKTNA